MKPRIQLFGDSHAHAVQTAILKREGKGQPVPLSAHRLLKEKNGVRIGTTSFEAFLRIVGDLEPKDVVVSMIGGNQHAVYSTIQHPRPFTFLLPSGHQAVGEGLELVPFRTIEHLFEKGLRSGDGRSLQALREATSARVVHVLPPPPKESNDHIANNHETTFAKDLARRGVSSPELRLKFWQLQRQVLAKLCAEYGIKLIDPPARAVNEAGFLRPEFYANDATHGNWLYGERVLRDIEKRFLGTSGKAREKSS
ncbi:hypothetical protein G7077_03315 [Sphingomonas piscis]|uniref:SGNH/GDSL hydrolase family protein n=1 Tax=Sphingomonas piscis TaxID=2714943 RepID=A0A6G7YMZ0_9SPHN|nr:hypothetical protein [Sphingomonas piscis]QIK78086.1 hypothetical protein G7077_03315 [Sphingomonas piscis]